MNGERLFQSQAEVQSIGYIYTQAFRVFWVFFVFCDWEATHLLGFTGVKVILLNNTIIKLNRDIPTLSSIKRYTTKCGLYCYTSTCIQLPICSVFWHFNVICYHGDPWNDSTNKRMQELIFVVKPLHYLIFFSIKGEAETFLTKTNISVFVRKWQNN